MADLPHDDPHAVIERGRFITFEGGEGAGKSTQVRLLSERLRDAGLDVVVTREPGGSPGAEDIRALLVRGEVARWDAMTEALLLNAARRDHWVRTIDPALANGQWVISDRFADSTLAYQGHGKGMDLEALRQMHRLALGDVWPDLTLVLDLRPEDGLARAGARGAIDGHAAGEDRFERTSLDFHYRMREGFLALASAEPKRFAVIDANVAETDVANAIAAALAEKFGMTL